MTKKCSDLTGNPPPHFSPPSLKIELQVLTEGVQFLEGGSISFLWESALSTLYTNNILKGGQFYFWKSLPPRLPTGVQYSENSLK